MLCRIASVLALAAGALAGSHPAQSDSWARIANQLVAGDNVVVEIAGHSAAAGRYVSCDTSEIVLWAGGSEQRVRRLDVARVIKLSRPYRRGALVGALVGAGIAGALFASGEDLNAAARIMWISIGAAGGAAVGLRADRYRKREIVYAR